MSKISRFFYSLWESLKISFSAIRKNKTRSSLTTMCIVIGIVSVTSMSTLINGIDRAFEDSLSMLGQNVVYIQKWPWGFGGEYKWWKYINRPEMKVKYVEEIRESARLVSAVSASSDEEAPVSYNGETAEDVNIKGATRSIRNTNPAELKKGRFYTRTEVQTSAHVAVIGTSVVEALFERGFPLGKRIRIAGQRFYVIGVYKERSSLFGPDQNNVITIPITTFQQTLVNEDDVQIAVKFPSKKVYERGKYEIVGVMRRIRNLGPLEENNFAINKPEAFKKVYNNMTSTIYMIGIFLTSLALFIGGIGVMNIMFVSVKERTKEIGLRKAVGAKAWEILFQFLIEAVIICLAGGIIGIGLSMLATQAIQQIFVAYLSWYTVFMAFGICTIVGLAFGFLPAYQAAKSEPIESLRYE